ncbi:MAG TPA: rhodanese-like domain-containing protein [Paracoccaceae bacterium]|nr:rhodanese-like domain-containing protein [Paracoccaceae bacterium]
MFNLFRGARAAGLSMPEAIERSQTGALTLIDVREAGEIAQTGKAKGALHVPLAMVPLKCDPKSGCLPKGLDPAKPVGVYCASGGRSGMAADKLRAMGFATVYNLGGLRDWVAAGGETER